MPLLLGIQELFVVAVLSCYVYSMLEDLTYPTKKDPKNKCFGNELQLSSLK